MSNDMYEKLLRIPTQNHLVSGDLIIGVTTGEDILKFSERDAAGNTIAGYHVVVQRSGLSGENGSITWQRTEVKSK